MNMFIDFIPLSMAYNLHTHNLRYSSITYNFTHAWYSMHGHPHVFACKIQKIAVWIIISTRQDVSLPETTHGICSRCVITWDVAMEVPISWIIQVPRQSVITRLSITHAQQKWCTYGTGQLQLHTCVIPCTWNTHVSAWREK